MIKVDANINNEKILVTPGSIVQVLYRDYSYGFLYVAYEKSDSMWNIIDLSKGVVVCVLEGDAPSVMDVEEIHDEVMKVVQIVRPQFEEVKISLTLGGATR